MAAPKFPKIYHQLGGLEYKIPFFSVICQVHCGAIYKIIKFPNNQIDKNKKRL
jgi:hypothetical protein